VIRAMIFDLDGTLVQTERLKALSYARAAIELCPRDITEEEVLEAFKEVVGLSRREVAQALVERFDLESAARVRMAEFGVSIPWQAFVQVRLRIYEEMLADPEVLRNNQWPHNMALLEEARRALIEKTNQHFIEIRDQFVEINNFRFDDLPAAESQQLVHQFFCPQAGIVNFFEPPVQWI